MHPILPGEILREGFLKELCISANALALIRVGLCLH